MRNRWGTLILVGTGVLAEGLGLLYVMRGDAPEVGVAIAIAVLPILLVSVGVLRGVKQYASWSPTAQRVGLPLLLVSLVAVSAGGPFLVTSPLRNLQVVSDNDTELNATTERVFQAAREEGAQAALTLLRRQAVDNPRLRLHSHHLAHQTGRLAIERAQFDLSALSDCTLEFASGCVHGMLERYFYARPSLDSDAVPSFCRDLSDEEHVGSRTLECSHGLGHGLAVGASHVVEPALQGCGRLRSAVEKRECADGVFMEVTNHALGGGHPGADSHEHALAETQTSQGSPECREVPEAYRESCWAYRYVVLHQQANGSWQGTVDGCRAADRANLVAACVFGVGKQVAQQYFTDWDSVYSFCSELRPDESAACISGAVEHIVDYDWTTHRAAAFCAGAPTTLSQVCYERLGRRIGYLHAGDAALKACIALAEEARAACRRGVGSVRTRKAESAGV